MFKEYLSVKNKEYLSVKNKGVIHRIEFANIVFLESSNKVIRISTINNEIITYGKLSDIMHQLPKDIFIFSHKSYIINLKHVVSLSTKGFLMNSGVTIPISRSYFQKAQKNFLQYLNL